MKTKFNRLSIALALLALSTLNAQLQTAFAQGALTPPGAPAPTMKSLDQIEARTPISSLPYTITNPGSYYVTANLTGASFSDGIDITTNNVTLDLNGFTLQGVANSYNGINVPNSAKNLVIRNGVVDSWGQYGVNADNGYNSQFERLRITSNSYGLVTGTNCIVLACTAYQNTYLGIFAANNSNVSSCNASGDSLISYGFTIGNNCTVIGCTASGNGVGINAYGNNGIFEDCRMSGNSAAGFLVSGTNNYVINSTASGNGVGISIGNNSDVQNCIASGNSTNGIYVPGSYCRVVGNTCSGNGHFGIEIVGSQNRIDGNTVGNNGSYGITTGAINLDNNITRNFSPGSGYGSYPGNNDYAPIQTPTNNPANPWANFQ